MRTQSVALDAMEQTQSLAGVQHRLHELADLTDSNAQLVATSVIAADEMNASASELREMVARTTVGHEPTPGASPEVVAPMPVANPATRLAPRPVVGAAAQPSAAVEFF